MNNTTFPIPSLFIFNKIKMGGTHSSPRLVFNLDLPPQLPRGWDYRSLLPRLTFCLCLCFPGASPELSEEKRANTTEDGCEPGAGFGSHYVTAVLCYVCIFHLCILELCEISQTFFCLICTCFGITVISHYELRWF